MHMQVHEGVGDLKELHVRRQILGRRPGGFKQHLHARLGSIFQGPAHHLHWKPLSIGTDALCDTITWIHPTKRTSDLCLRFSCAGSEAGRFMWHIFLVTPTIQHWITPSSMDNMAFLSRQLQQIGTGTERTAQLSCQYPTCVCTCVCRCVFLYVWVFGWSPCDAKADHTEGDMRVHLSRSAISLCM